MQRKQSTPKMIVNLQKQPVVFINSLYKLEQLEKWGHFAFNNDKARKIKKAISKVELLTVPLFKWSTLF